MVPPGVPPSRLRPSPWAGGEGDLGVAGTDGAPGVHPGAVGGRLHSWLSSSDGRAVVVLVIVPVLFFAVPAAFGHPAITGDNLIQNFPLRVLTGRQLRQGHLPLWNPYIWSGSPLLGGLNSGSFYPFTIFFAVLAPVAAFVVNLLGVYWAAGLGMYALCRQYRLRPLASFLGAFTYAFFGAMSGQLVHLGVIQGMGWMPLFVLALLRLSWVVLGTGPAREGDRSDEGVAGQAGASVGASRGDGAHAATRRASSPWPWVALIALIVGLEALTGEPRAMVETEVVGALVAAWAVLRRYPRVRVGLAARVRLSGYVVLAGLWGVALAAAELAPGWTFIKASQRAVETFQFFGTGSLRPSWSLLLLVPDLFGGAGHFGSAHYFNGYNLPEVTGYAGLLPLGAALGLLVRSFGRRRAARASDWGMWLALAALGLLLTWGSFTPLGHVWAVVPLLGKTRLQSRNIEIVDFALAVLFAFWVDGAISARAPAATAGADVPADPFAADSSARRGPRWLPARPARWLPARPAEWLPAAPAAAAIALCAITLAAPLPVEEWLHATPSGAALARGLWPWFLAQAVVAAGVIALIGGWRRLGISARRRLLVGLVVADFAFFALATSTGGSSPTVTLQPTHAAAAAVLGTRGRFAIVDTTVTDVESLSAVGQPDLNAFTRLPSVQGYGSIVSDRYGAATGSHRLDTLNPCALETGRFATLRLSTLLTSPGDLVVSVGSHVQPRAGSGPAQSSHCQGAPQPGTTRRRAFFLGWPVALRSVTLVSRSAPPPAGTPVVSVVGPDGAVRQPAQSVRRTDYGWSVTFDKPATGAGIVVEGPAREIADSSTVQSVSGGRWMLDGRFQDAVDTSSWRFVGTFAHTFGIFRRTGRIPPPVWIATASPGSSVRQLSAPDWGGATDRVVASHQVTVVWSESYLPGWHATLAPAPAAGGGGGASVGRTPRATRTQPLSLAVHRRGLLQAVEVPPGAWILTFHYRPRLLTLGFAGSALAVAGFLVLLVLRVGSWRSRRSRRSRRSTRRSTGFIPGSRVRTRPTASRRRGSDNGDRTVPGQRPNEPVA